MSRGLPRVLVLTGTSDHPFPRLLDALPALVREGVAAEVRVQSALPVAEAPGLVALGVLSREAVAAELAAADVVIAHGGSGSCFDAIRAGHRPIVVPRKRALGESVDDHQADVASALHEAGSAVVAREPLSDFLVEDVRDNVSSRRPAARTSLPMASRLRALLPRGKALRGGTRGTVEVVAVESGAYTAFYSACPRPHPLQSVAWGEARRLDGWTPSWWMARTARGGPLAAAQVLRRAPLAPAYVPYGPATLETEESLRAGWSLVRRIARTSAGGLLWTPATAELLRSSSGSSGVELEAPSTTGLVPLGSDEELLARMRGTWRWSLRKGLKTEQLTVAAEDALTFTPLLLRRVRELAVAKGFRPPVREEVGAAFAARAATSGVRLLALSTRLGDRVTSRTLVALAGDTARTLWTAHEEDADESSGRVAMWGLLRRCRDLGAASFDLSGIDDEGNPGVASFKRGLRPDLEIVPSLRWLTPAWLPPIAGSTVRAAASALRRATADR